MSEISGSYSYIIMYIHKYINSPPVIRVGAAPAGQHMA